MTHDERKLLALAIRVLADAIQEDRPMVAAEMRQMLGRVQRHAAVEARIANQRMTTLHPAVKAGAR